MIVGMRTQIFLLSPAIKQRPGATQSVIVLLRSDSSTTDRTLARLPVRSICNKKQSIVEKKSSDVVVAAMTEIVATVASTNKLAKFVLTVHSENGFRT